MVATIGKLTSSNQAGSYYEADDYYLGDDLAPSAWAGEGAERLGLAGEVDRDTFRALLSGEVAGEQLGTMREGQLVHRPGWDLTLSCAKSVSIMALVAGDRRLIHAHQKAVATALGHIERNMAVTRVRSEGGITREATTNLAIASFLHTTSRANPVPEAQLHSHNVILNATQSGDGKWRSLDPQAIYQFQMHIGALFRQELARHVVAIGYQIEVGKDSMFELRGVPQSVIDAFSSRKAEIDARLEERGTNRVEASAEEKQIAALDTRSAKKEVDRAELLEAWRERADALGFDEVARRALVAEAELRAGSMLEGGSAVADRAIAHAAEMLGEREAVFSATALMRAAGEHAFGKLNYAEIEAAVDRANRTGELVQREFLDRRGASFPGFTTRTNIEHEKAFLRIEAQGRGKAEPILSPIEAAKTTLRAERASQRAGFTWTAEQRTATVDILSGRNRIAAIQGLAGTAKTTTVVATIANAARAQGYAITALAPTASAASVLSDALKLRSDTVARHLVVPERQAAGKKALWLVDEASLISARDMARLFEAAVRAEARLLLIGDAGQLRSVGAGRAFAQLQDAGMKTAILENIVRQTNPLTKEAVEASIEGNARRALAALDRGGGEIVAEADGSERLKAMARDFSQLSIQEQKQTIVIEPSRAGRDALNVEIRSKLKALGILSGDAVSMRTLESKSLTKAEARDARSYERGDIVRFAKAYPDKDVVRGEALTVIGINAEMNALRLEKENGQSVDWRPRQWGAAKTEVFTPGQIELMKGDRIEFTRNDRNLNRINGGQAEIVGVDTESRTARIRSTSGRFQTLSLDRAADQHLRHGYVQTAYAAQGRTAERVMIHADSRATNLVNQKMLYIAISRAKTHAAIYTDDRDRLASAIAMRAGNASSALENDMSGKAQLDRGAVMG